MNLTESDIREAMNDPNFFKLHIARDRVGMYGAARQKGLIDYDRSKYHHVGGLSEGDLEENEMPVLVTKGISVSGNVASLTGDDIILTGFGSSEAVDTDDDQMTHKAMEKLTTASKGMTTWVDHKFTQDWLLGSLMEQPVIAKGVDPKTGLEFTGVQVKSDVETESANGVRSAKFVAKGRRLGWSVGCIYKEVEKVIDRRTGKTKGVKVHDVEPIEWSLVGMPSNQLCWAYAVAKAMKTKGFLPVDDDEREIAYVFKGSQYQDLPPAIAGRFEKLNTWLDSSFPEAGICLAVKAAKVQSMLRTPEEGVGL